MLAYLGRAEASTTSITYYRTPRFLLMSALFPSHSTISVLNMDTFAHFEETNTFNIYRTPIREALMRPPSEPPDINIVSLYRTQEMKDLHKDILNPTLGSEFLDLYMETDALIEYRNWMSDAARAAVAVPSQDQERERFF